MVPMDATRGEGRGAVEKERKVENALFFKSLVHMRAQLCLRVISFPNLFYPMEIRHPSECVCMCVRTCILLERVAFVCVSV